MKNVAFILISLFIFAVLFLNPVKSEPSASGTVNGTASLPDSSDWSGIYVTVIGQNNTVVTDASGNFILNNVQAGIVKIQAGKLGYHNAVADTFLLNGETISLALHLSSTINDTGEIIQTPNFTTLISNEGNIGSVNTFVDSSGTGFKWQGVQQLREASLMIGTDSSHVSDAARFILGIAQDNMDHDFQSRSDIIVRTFGPDSTVLITSFDDSRSNLPPGVPSQPLGISIVQESYAFSGPQDNGSLIIKLNLTNRTSSALNNLIIGYFVDWDILPTPDNNRGDVIQVQNQIPGFNGGLPFTSEIAIQRDATSGTKFMAVVPLSQPQFKAARIASVAQEIVPSGQYLGLTEENKYFYMRDRRNGNDATDLGNEEDLATIVSLGGLTDTTYSQNLFTLPPHGQLTAGFAFAGGNDSLTCITNALNAQKKWVELGNQMLIITDVGEEHGNIPAEFRLEQNYPNPFNPLTIINYQLTVSDFISLKIFDVLGREITTLVDKLQQPGYYHVTWDASNNPAGVYFYRLQTSRSAQTKKLLLIK